MCMHSEYANDISTLSFNYAIFNIACLHVYTMTYSNNWSTIFINALIKLPWYELENNLLASILTQLVYVQFQNKTLLFCHKHVIICRSFEFVYVLTTSCTSIIQTIDQPVYVDMCCSFVIWVTRITFCTKVIFWNHSGHFSSRALH